MNLILIGAYELYHIGGDDLRKDEGAGMFEVIYTKPYCRATVYFIGILCGIVLYNRRQYEKNSSSDDRRALFISGTFDNKYCRYGGFIIGIMMLNFLMFV